MSNDEIRNGILEEENKILDTYNRGLHQQLWKVQKENLVLIDQVHKFKFALFAITTVATTTILLLLI